MSAGRNPTSSPTETTRLTPDPCDVCGGPTYERNCKLICRRCGYTRDCGDP